MQEFTTETQCIVAEWEQRIRREAREDTRRALVTRPLTERFGTLFADSIARLDAANPALLETWASRLLDADTIDDVFAE